MQGFFRMPCDNPLIVERIDPIISPGAVSGHVHTLSGGSNLSPSATYDDMRKSKCSSCLAKADMSAYWTPQLYFHWKNGTFTIANQVGGGLIYYLPRYHSSDKTNVTAFPAGFKMLAGNPFLRSYNSSNLQAQAIGWNCLGGTTPTRNPYLPSENCPDGLRGEVRFPSCWDGKNLYKTDQSHMAYSDGESGPCPSTHPTRLITLFYEMMFSVDDFKAQRSLGSNSTQPFVLAMGDATGYGYHGDFLNGWDVPTLQLAMDTCTNNSGAIEDCKVLALYDRATEGSCRKTPDVNEIVTGTSPKLPGCNPVSSGSATVAPPTCPNLKIPAFFNPTSVYTGAVAPPGANVLSNTPQVVKMYQNWKYLDCYSDAAPARALPNGLRTVAKSVNSCLDAATTAGYKYAGLEYGGECWAGNSLPSSSLPVGYGKCFMPCVDSPLQWCGGPGTFDLYSLTTKMTRKGRHLKGDN